MSTKAPGEILELFRGGYLSIAETIDALDGIEGYVSVELLNIERTISDDLRQQNAKLREAAATPPVSPLRGRGVLQRIIDTTHGIDTSAVCWLRLEKIRNLAVEALSASPPEQPTADPDKETQE